jgi:hypothetical protein
VLDSVPTTPEPPSSAEEGSQVILSIALWHESLKFLRAPDKLYRFGG